ncbi:MAG TPA: sugar porter family MFS transporter [Actinospica sp.]|jgi:sugar porter (SP) family MFS transporter|nr:sugar porter family MFS transporter [Actinospica sp.]
MAIGLTSGTAALGGLLFGYDTGVVSGALLYLKKEFGGLSSFQQELVTSLLLVGCMVGAFAGGRVADRIGRRPTLAVTALVFVAGVLLAAFAPNLPVLLAARFVIGLAVGTSSMVVPLYIGEMAPARVRGGLVSLNQLAITVGILAAYLVDYALSGSGNWRLMFGLAAIPAAVLFIGMLFQRESPHWLIGQGRGEEAHRILERLRGSDDDIDAEVEEVRRLGRRKSGYRELLSPKIRPALFVGIALAVFQQITGVNTVIYYAPTLLQGAGLGSSSAILAEVCVGGINVLLTILAVWLMDRVGRRPLLLIGTTGMLIGLLTVACAFLGGDHLTGGAAIVAIVGLMFFQGSFAIGLGPVFWLLIAEIYPLKVRGTAMGLATIANWAADFVVTISFLTLLNAVSGVGTFLLFAFLTLAALIYFRIKVPETKGRSLQDIESELETAGAA